MDFTVDFDLVEQDMLVVSVLNVATLTVGIKLRVLVMCSTELVCCMANWVACCKGKKQRKDVVSEMHLESWVMLSLILSSSGCLCLFYLIVSKKEKLRLFNRECLDLTSD